MPYTVNLRSCGLSLIDSRLPMHSHASQLVCLNAPWWLGIVCWACQCCWLLLPSL